MRELQREWRHLAQRELGQRELTDALATLREETRRLARGASTLGAFIVLCHAVILPLNVIINAFPVAAARSLYQRIAIELYREHGASGTRADGGVMQILKTLKGVLVAELSSRGLAHYVPGVTVLVGLAEDSLSLVQALRTVGAGSAEFVARVQGLNRQIDRAEQEILRIGQDRATILDRLARADNIA